MLSSGDWIEKNSITEMEKICSNRLRDRKNNIDQGRV